MGVAMTGSSQSCETRQCSCACHESQSCEKPQCSCACHESQSGGNAAETTDNRDESRSADARPPVNPVIELLGHEWVKGVAKTVVPLAVAAAIFVVNRRRTKRGESAQRHLKREIGVS
jgi:hypothetical protein